MLIGYLILINWFSSKMVKTYRNHYVWFRSTCPSRLELTARNARSTPSTRSHSTRRVKLLLADRASVVMPQSSRVSVARPSPFSERRPRPQRRSLSSLNALSARPVDLTPSSVASHSFLERKMSPRVAPSSERWVLWREGWSQKLGWKLSTSQHELLSP